jgi:hypothetical protein
VQGGHAYVGTSSGLLVLDVSDPAKPVLAGMFGTNAITGIAVRDNHVYVVGTEFQILRIDVLPKLTTELFNGELQLLWPTNAGDYLLESTTNLVLPQWNMVTGLSGISNGFHRVSVPVTNPAAYFRLRSVGEP